MRGAGARPVIHGLTVFLAAFLLFAVQPMAGKRLLPWFGGVPAVWSAALAFFQLALLAGYLWADRLARRPPRWQARWHVRACLVVLAALLVQELWWGAPLLPGEAARRALVGGGGDGGGVRPAVDVLWLLALGVGLPFTVLAATGPLVQAWYTTSRPGQSPYHLYALSNLGSLAGLLCYPTLVERVLPLPYQARAWALAFAALVGALAVCGRELRASGTSSGTSAGLGAGSDPAAPSADDGAQDGAQPVRRRAVGAWLALACAPVIALLATTALISEELAPVPLLWVVPLALYLLTMIGPFAAPAPVERGRPWLQLVALLVCGGALYALLAERPPVQVPWLRADQQPIAWALLALGGLGLACHGALVDARPAPSRLTTYYLAIAAGGAAGGLFVGLLAPSILPRREELYLGYLLGVAAVAVALVARLGGWRRWLAGALSLALLAGLGWLSHDDRQRKQQGQLLALRNFFGLVEVYRHQPGTRLEVHELRHGAVMHGLQLRAPGLRHVATGYYGRDSGVGLAIHELPARAAGPITVDLVGLGAGTLAAYARRGDRYRFYEINPAVVALAEDPRWFSFVDDARARGADVALVEDDGRLALADADRAGAPRCDVLVVDAFGGDAVPTHLLTAEAAALYARRLRPGGVLAMHVSNRQVDLRPVVLGMAEALGWRALTVRHRPPRDRGHVTQPSEWILLSADEALFARPALARLAREPMPAVEPVRWTDQFSNVLAILRTGRQPARTEQR